jgi:hypothetical protein
MEGMDGTEAHGGTAQTYELTTKHVLIVFLGVLALLGFAMAYLQVLRIPEPKALQLGSTLLFSVLTFTWFWLDSEARAYKRSPWLNVGIVAFGLFAIPYYLVRSRPKGQRLKAVAKCVGFALLLWVAFALGSLPVLLLMQ